MTFKEHTLMGAWGGARFAYIGAFFTALLSDFTLSESLGVAGQALISGFLAGGICMSVYYSLEKHNVLRCVLAGYLGVLIFSLGNSLIIQNTIFSNTLLLVKGGIMDSVVSSGFVCISLVAGLYYFSRKGNSGKSSIHNRVKLPEKS